MEKVAEPVNGEKATRNQSVLVTHTDRHGKKRLRIMTIKRPDTRPGFKTRPAYFSETFNIFVVWRGLLVECIATGLFTFFACGSVAAGAIYGLKTAAANVLALLVQGYAIAMLVYAIAHTSGGHINPAVTTSLVVSGHVGILRGIAYILSQLVGAIIGAAILQGVIPEQARQDLGFSLGTTVLSDGTNQNKGVWFEFMMTFALLFTIYGTAINTESAVNGSHVLAPLPIGFAVAVGVGVAFGFTGGSLNPARTFGPALISGTWTDHWVYWVGPIGAAIIMGVLQRYVFLVEYDHKTHESKKLKNKTNKYAAAAAKIAGNGTACTMPQMAPVMSRRRQSTISMDDIDNPDESAIDIRASQLDNYRLPTSSEFSDDGRSSSTEEFPTTQFEDRKSSEGSFTMSQYDQNGRRESITEVVPLSDLSQRRQSIDEVVPLSEAEASDIRNSGDTEVQEESESNSRRSSISPPEDRKMPSARSSTSSIRNRSKNSSTELTPLPPLGRSSLLQSSRTLSRSDMSKSGRSDRPDSSSRSSLRETSSLRPPKMSFPERRESVNPDVFYVPRNNDPTQLKHSRRLTKAAPAELYEEVSIYDPPTPSASTFSSPVASPSLAARSSPSLRRSLAEEIVRSALIERSPPPARSRFTRSPRALHRHHHRSSRRNSNPLAESTDEITPLPFNFDVDLYG